MRSPHQIRGKKSFTLIELLVVVSIIAILAAILLPALQRAKRSALAVNCLSNLRQLAVWGLGYTSDNDSFLPHNGYEWNDPTPPTGSASRYYWRLSSNWFHEKVTDNGNGDIVHCPQAQSSVPMHKVSRKRSYGLAKYRGGLAKWENPVPDANLKTRLLDDSSYWFADAPRNDFYALDDDWRWGHGIRAGMEIFDFSLKKNVPWPWMAPIYKIAGHPGDKTNFVFGDGHAEGISYVTVNKMEVDDRIHFSGSDWDEN